MAQNGLIKNIKKLQIKIPEINYHISYDVKNTEKIENLLKSTKPLPNQIQQQQQQQNMHTHNWNNELV